MINTILIVYVISSILAIIFDYKTHKRQGETVRVYLKTCLLPLFPVLNTLYVTLVVVNEIKESPSIKSFLDRKL